jgi:hypothetical protein
MPHDLSLLPDDATPEQRAWLQEVQLLGTQRGRYVVSSFIAWLEAAEARLSLLVENQRQGRPTFLSVPPAAWTTSAD